MTRFRHFSFVLFCTLAYLPQLAAAETIDLVCSHENGFSLNFSIDTLAQSVVVDGKPARKVLIEANSINFTVDLADGAYFHSINRSTGNLTVRAPNGALIHGHRCERAKPKF